MFLLLFIFISRPPLINQVDSNSQAVLTNACTDGSGGGWSIVSKGCLMPETSGSYFEV